MLLQLKSSFFFLALTKNNYAGWNQNLCALFCKYKLWNYRQLKWGLHKAVLEKRSDWEKISIEAAHFMTSTIKTLIQVKLTKEEFNNGYKMYE